MEVALQCGSDATSHAQTGARECQEEDQSSAMTISAKPYLRQGTQLRKEAAASHAGGKTDR